MNLWDLELGEIPCGWQNVYDYALTECPEGNIIEPDEFSDKRYFMIL
jgi:hypothetical protein